MTGEELKSSALIRSGLSAPFFDAFVRVCHRLDASSYAPSTDSETAIQLVNDIAGVLSNLPARTEAIAGPEITMSDKELIAT
jgi:hypothetical protein